LILVDSSVWIDFLRGTHTPQARKLDVYRGIANFRSFADLGKTAHGEFYETHLPDGSELINYTKRKPLGVVASISPWNLPILSLTWKAAPALACAAVCRRPAAPFACWKRRRRTACACPSCKPSSPTPA